MGSLGSAVVCPPALRRFPDPQRIILSKPQFKCYNFYICLFGESSQGSVLYLWHKFSLFFIRCLVLFLTWIALGKTFCW
jgi:hypothetical protein